jgi:hypoxanthine phosphoribosyltransferase
MESKDELREILSPSAIQDRVRELGKQITEDYRNRPVVVIGILNGAFIFLADLVRAIDLPLQVDFVRLVSYAGSQTTGQVSITKDVELVLKDKDILVVEDIVDTGYTLEYLKEVLKLHRPASVKICCLIDKKERREVPIEVDYAGFDVQRGFLVGYGLDYEENYRQLSGIFHLSPHYEPEAFNPSER